MNKHALLLLLVITLTVGCATTQEKEIVYIPKEVKVSVYRGIVLDIPPEPVYEACSQLDITERIRCIGRNVEKLRFYSKALLVEIESNNTAAEEPPSVVAVDLNENN